MSKVSVDKKSNKVFLEISIEEAFATLSSLAFSKTGKSFDFYCELYQSLGRPTISWNPSSDNHLEAAKEQQKLVDIFKKTTFAEVPAGYCFRVTGESYQRIYVKSNYPNSTFNSYFISENCLIHADIDESHNVEILGKANFHLSY